MNVLILGTMKKLMPVWKYCRENGYGTLVIRSKGDQFYRDKDDEGNWFYKIYHYDSETNSSVLDKNSVWPGDLNMIANEDLKGQLFYDFFPRTIPSKSTFDPFIFDTDKLIKNISDGSQTIDKIVNFTEQKYFLQLEYELSNALNLNTFLTKDLIKFFSNKKEQDRIFKSLDIPTVPNESNLAIVKYDGQGGAFNFEIIKRNEDQVVHKHDDLVPPRADITSFVQDYVDIDYIISCHFYSDENKWYHINNHIMHYEENCPTQSKTPYELTGTDKTIIEESIQKLSKEIKIKNKLFGWQFLKDKSGNLYSIDFNLRPFGGFDAGSYDTDISEENWSSYLFDNLPPEYITYTDTIECVYKEPRKMFGYGELDKVKTTLLNSINYKVNTYDN